MKGLECIHEDLLKWGCPNRRRLFLRTVQTSIASLQALIRLAIREARADKFA